MSSVNSDTYTAQQTFPEGTTVGVKLGCPVVVYEAKVTIATDFDAATDTANLFTVPAGMRPIPEMSSVTTEALGTTATIDIGTAANADAYADGIDVHAAALVPFTGGVEALTPVTTTDTTTVIATLATANTLTAGKTFTVKMAFAKI